jgi:crotonobetaine/carnitine-CoA ligase
MSGNSPATVVAWLGAIQAGAVPAAVNPELTAPELTYLGGDLEPALVLADLARLQNAEVLARQLKVPALAVEDLGAGADAISVPELDPMQTAAIVYTSGTTSRPKGVQVRHAAYTETGQSFPGWIGLTGRQRLWAVLPLFHINAQAYSLMTALAHGFTLALSEKFHASTFWREAQALEVTSVNVIGAMLAFLERQPLESWVESGLRTIYAAPAPAHEHRLQLEERFGVRIAGGYGMSENTFGCVESPSSRLKPGSVGRPRQPASGRFVNQVRIVTEGGREAGPGEVGELRFSNPVLTPGYWRAPHISARALAGGWLHTGDAGFRDVEGDLVLTGRLKEMIRRRGENISPGEVEDALLEHPVVASAAVFGVPSEATEEEVVAAVVLTEGAGATAEELRSFARERLAAYKVPKEIIIRESLPMTPTMRVARDALRREYLEADERAGR